MKIGNEIITFASTAISIWIWFTFFLQKSIALTDIAAISFLSSLLCYVIYEYGEIKR